MKPKYTLCVYVLFQLLFLCRASAQAPVEFIQNKGQWGNWFQYKAPTIAGEIFMEQDGFRYLLCDATNAQKMDSFGHGQLKKNPLMKFHVYKVSFTGSKAESITGSKPEKTYYNYYWGNDPSKWKSGIHPYQELNYKNLYNGIDMHVSSEGGMMVYEFYVSPGANAGVIKMNYDGPDDMWLKNGNLVINTSVGQVKEMKPEAYQVIHNEKVQVACNYHLEGNQLTFSFPQGYDHSHQLVIDPTVVFCSFTGSTADNWGFTATYDNQGNFYAGGLVNALASVGGGSYPVSPGAYQSTFAGGEGASAVEYGADIGIMKFNSTGTSRVYATYLGGSGNERPFSMIVDTGGNLIVSGRTHSIDFPVTAGAYQPNNAGGWDGIVTKFNSTATALLASTYMGGSADDGVNYDSTEIGYGQLKFNYGDDARSEIQVDKAGNIYVTSCTESTDFPTTPTAISTTLSGAEDGVVYKLNSTLSTLLWSTYIGGSNYDAGYVLAFDTSQSAVYVAGGTNSTDFPVTPGTWHTTYGGDTADGFILKFQNAPPYNLLKGTYVGTAHYDQVYGIQVDDYNNVWVMGQSIGGTFPVTAGVYTNPNSGQFVMEIDSNLSNDMISTVYGNGNTTQSNISPVAFLVDTCGNVYISGWGGNLSLASPHSGMCTGMPITPDAYQDTTDGMDFYFIVFGPSLSTLRYGTYYGRYDPSVAWHGEHVDGGTSRFDKHGIIYQGICANCGGPSSPPFPTTAGSWATLDGSDNCNEAALKIAFNIAPVSAAVSAGPSTSGCSPLTVDFSNYSISALSYVWNFGDGSPLDTTFAPTHTFTASGTFTVTLTANNSNACFRTSDTAYLTIVVGTNNIQPAFTYLVNDSCNPYTVTFTNTSHYSSTTGSTTFTRFIWTFGDGTTYTGTTPPTHNYPSTGTYVVTLLMIDSTSCNSPDSVSETVVINSNDVSANFTIPDTICVGSPITPVVTSTNVTISFWNFGNGDTSNASTPTYTYTATGTYTVTYVASSPTSCNGSVTITSQVTVLAGPVKAAFTDVVIDSCNPFVVSFDNTSQYSTTPGAVSFTIFHWFFGDGSSYTGANPPPHNYPDTGTYIVTLVMIDTTSCNSPDTATKPITIKSYYVSASFNIPDTICLGRSFTPNVTNTNATNYSWSFGNGATSTANPPTYAYDSVGTYTVTYIVSSSSTCNGADTITATITVLLGPIANFTFSPSPPTMNTPINYINLSINATSYLWEFGDNTTSTEVDPVHMYDKTGTYKTILYAYNNSTCPDSFALDINADIVPIVGLPTAFTPGEGNNNILYVRGAVIQTMDLKIYNRWGQLVFESTDQNKGWDGTFNGQPQPVDAYAYVLYVTFINGTDKLLKGNITLLR